MYFPNSIVGKPKMDVDQHQLPAKAIEFPRYLHGIWSSDGFKNQNSTKKLIHHIYDVNDEMRCDAMQCTNF